MTPSLKIDSVSTIPILNVGDTIQVEFSVYAKLKIESGDRNFEFRVKEFSGQDLDPEPMSFPTLKVTPPNLVVTDFAKSVTTKLGGVTFNVGKDIGSGSKS